LIQTRNTHKHTRSLTIRLHVTKSFAISSHTSGSRKQEARVVLTSNDRLFISTKFGKKRAIFRVGKVATTKDFKERKYSNDIYP
jgi:hypothetical protein